MKCEIMSKNRFIEIHWSRFELFLRNKYEKCFFLKLQAFKEKVFAAIK